MYVTEIHCKLTEQQIDDALAILKKEVMATRTLVLLVDRAKGDCLLATSHPERDGEQTQRLLKALNQNS